jgi:DNA helicase HerA-like ATPase
MLARLFGKSDVYSFKVEIFGDVKTFDFLKVHHHESGDILTQVINITRDNTKLIGDCKIIGYRSAGVLKNIRTPFANDALIEIADDSFIESTVGLNSQDDAFLGVLEHHPNLRITMDLKKTITKHIAVLAKSGAGKSYTVGVLLEEIIKKNIPIIILDPHNEYSSLKYPNTDKKDIKRLEKFGLKPEGFLDRIKEYSPDTVTNPQCEPITLDINKLKPQDVMDALPQKLSPGQQALMFNILSSVNNRVDFDELIFNISNEESNAKWSLISLIEQLKKYKLYSTAPTPLQELVKYKRASIISLKGVDPYVQETFVAGLLRDLFEARKREEIPPFFLVLEECHNFCPESSMGKKKSSNIIRTIAGEGRKFGIGLCAITQRPAKVDKNVISQCTTQILLKITNPNDLKSVIASSEGVDSTSENEIQKLNIGTGLITGVIDIPLKTNIRPRVSKHGGDTVDITMSYENDNADSTKNNSDAGANVSYGGQTGEQENEKQERENNVNNTSKTYKGAESEFIQYIAPELEVEDAKTMMNTDNIAVEMVPASLVKMKTKNGETTLLFDRTHKKIIKTLFPYTGLDVSESLMSLSDTEKKLFKIILELKDSFNPAELLIKTDVMFNEILRICDSLGSKGILERAGKEFHLTGGKFLKELDTLNFFGNQKFEEVSFDKTLTETISEEDTKSLFSIFGDVTNVKSIFMLRYVEKS